jgi:hypothetical protein
VVLLSLHARNEVINWTISDDGASTGAWTQQANVDQAQAFIGVELWSMVAGATETITITADDVTTNNQAAYIIARAFSGVDTATNDGIEALASTVGPGTDDNDMLYSVTTVTANAWAVAVGSTLSASLTVEAGVENAIQINYVGSCGSTFKGHMWYEGPVATPAATQLGVLNDLSGNNDWCEIVVSLKPSGGAPPAAAPRLTLMGVGDD